MEVLKYYSKHSWKVELCMTTYIPCTVRLAGLLSTDLGGNPSIVVMLRQRYIPVRFTVALVIVR